MIPESLVKKTSAKTHSDGVVATLALDQVNELVDSTQQGGGAARLQDESVLCYKHGALTVKMGERHGI